MLHQTPAERLEIVRALYARPALSADARAAIAVAYPGAPASMVNTAVHHLYIDGCSAALDFMADAELCLREPGRKPDTSVAIELLYHVYNWRQFEAMLPSGRQDLIELVAQLKELVADKDWEAVTQSVEELVDLVEGSRNPPEIP